VYALDNLQLDENVREQINRIVEQRVRAAERVATVTNVKTCIQVPVYDSKRMTSEAFLKKCRLYFIAPGYSPAQFHEVLPMVLKGEFKLWYESAINEINSWDDFVTKFRARFDNETVKRKRLRTLYTRRQNQNDPSETFIYEMVALSKQINPTESNEVTFKRCVDALLPDISALFTDLQELQNEC